MVVTKKDNGMPPNTDILDSLIAVAIILFIVSMIVEKITQLVRRYAPFGKPDPWGTKTTYYPVLA
jgi:hypothetical protein